MKRDPEQNPFLKESEERVAIVHFGFSCGALGGIPKQVKGRSHRVLQHN